MLSRDPYSVDFTHEAEKAKNMETGALLGALKDAIEASRVSGNSGKYFDQLSVYRKELTGRGMPISEQDQRLESIKSLHTTPQQPTSQF